MFGGWAHLASPPEDLTEKERSPPPKPTLLDFPSYTPHEPPRALTSASCRDLFRLLCTIRKTRDITPEYLRPLNLNVQQNVSFQDLLPPATESPQDVWKTTTSQDRLQQTIQELRIPHTDAFREVVRLPGLPGRPRVRLSQTRKFWAGLEKMSQYWDCSMDQFYAIPNSKDEEAEAASISSDSDSNIEMSNTSNHSTGPSIATANRPTKQVYKGRRIGTGSCMPPSHRDEAVSGLVETVVWAYNCQVRAPNLPPRLAVRTLLFPVRQSFIVGRVPREKEIARRSVLEGPIMGVCCRRETKFHEQIIETGIDTDRHQGTIDDGVGPDGQGTSWREILDLAREIGVMLLLAQERAREGKEEIKSGDGKWWTTRPRWGGGPGGPVMEDDNDNTPLSWSSSSDRRPGEEVLPPPLTTPENTLQDDERPSTSTGQKRKDRASESSNADTTSGADFPSAQHKKEKSTITPTTTTSSSSSSKLAQTERWKLLRPGPGIWDQRMKYMRIGAGDGKDKEDTIFMVSALNHHVALLRLDVEAVWLDWLAGAEDEAEAEAEIQGQPFSSEEKSKQLSLKRTRWFDLFNEDDRVEFVQGLGHVMAWLMR